MSNVVPSSLKHLQKRFKTTRKDATRKVTKAKRLKRRDADDQMQSGEHVLMTAYHPDVPLLEREMCSQNPCFCVCLRKVVAIGRRAKASTSRLRIEYRFSD